MKNIEKIWLTDDAVWIKTTEGQQACEKFENYPRLKYATPAQREHFETNAFGIYWPEIDEDLSFDGFFEKKERNSLYRIFVEHPELNASAIARRLGLAQSLLAQYISVTKHPSKERMEMMKSEIRKIGEELQLI